MSIDSEAIEKQGEIMAEVEVYRLVEGLGYGNPDGISYHRRVESGEVTGEDLQLAEDWIASNDVLVKVDNDKQGNMLDDDGCSDGRPWINVIKKVGDEIQEKAKSLIRPKQFGGGITMAAAGLIGTGRAAGRTLRQVFSDGIRTLEDKRLGFGAHTDIHAHGPNCGCGAIDRAPENVENVLKYEEQIRGVFAKFGASEAHINRVFDNFRAFAPTMKPEEYTGKSVSDEIIDEGKIVKKLDGNHLEMYILLNNVFGYTVDQAKIREITGDKIQVFPIDIWRMRQLAQEIYTDPDDPENEQNLEDQEVAFLSQLAYSLGTAGTLTDGTLPVYVIDEKN